MTNSEPHNQNPNTPSSDNDQSCSNPFELGSIALALGTEKPKTINPKDLNEHFYMLGRSGTGKSNLLKQ